MKLEEKRKKGKAKTKETRDANAVVQHQTSQNFAATTYQSPRAVAPPRVVAPPPPSGGVNPVWARLGLMG